MAKCRKYEITLLLHMISPCSLAPIPTRYTKISTPYVYFEDETHFHATARTIFIMRKLIGYFGSSHLSCLVDAG